MKIFRVILSVLVFYLMGSFLLQAPDANAWVVAGKPDYPVAPVHKKLEVIYTDYANLAKELDNVLAEKNVSSKEYSPWRASWEKRMMLAEERLHQLYPYFMPINQHPWTREAAVFTNLQGVREWHWPVEQDENSIVDGQPNFAIENGKIYKRNIDMYRGFMVKAGTILTGGPFYGNFFKDTQATILANYCVYPEVHGDGTTHMTKLVKPSFQKMGLQNGLAMEGKDQSQPSATK
jgi:hypothetical protein